MKSAASKALLLVVVIAIVQGVAWWAGETVPKWGSVLIGIVGANSGAGFPASE